MIFSGKMVLHPIKLSRDIFVPLQRVVEKVSNPSPKSSAPVPRIKNDDCLKDLVTAEGKVYDSAKWWCDEDTSPKSHILVWFVIQPLFVKFYHHKQRCFSLNLNISLFDTVKEALLFNFGHSRGGPFREEGSLENGSYSQNQMTRIWYVFKSFTQYFVELTRFNIQFNKWNTLIRHIYYPTHYQN